MKKSLSILFVIILILILLSSCSSSERGELYKVGLITEGEMTEYGWNALGYKGIQHIKDKYTDVEIYYEENIETEEDVLQAVDDFAKKGVNLLFGHSSQYGKYFVDIANYYPDIHFVYFNGGYTSDNVTSLNVNVHALGFFAGLIAGEMTETNEVAIFAAYEWQSEIEGFYEGVKHANPGCNVRVEFIQEMTNKDKIREHYYSLIEDHVDVIYPANDMFSTQLIKEASEDGLYTIGYMMDQSDIGQEYVLSSTLLNIDRLYLYAAEQKAKDNLKGTVYTFKHEQDIVSLSEYSPFVPAYVKNKINRILEDYHESGLLPY